MSKFSLKPQLIMILSAILTGIAVGLGVILFVKLFALLHNVFFMGKISFKYDEFIHTPPSVFGVGIIFIPALGSLLITLIIERFARGERGLSIPEIIYSIHFQQAKIAIDRCLAKVFAALVSISSGGSIGREGPIILLGATLSAIISKMTELTTSQKIVLLACGAATGTAVAFNAPVTGLVFVIEVFKINPNFFGVFLILLAESTALLLKWIFFHHLSIFSYTAQNMFLPLDWHLLLFFPFGVLIGFFSLFVIKGIYYTEDIFTKLFKNAYIKHAIGMLIVGILLYLFMHFFGYYYIQGNGYSTINDLLKFVITNPWLLFLLVIGKVLATFLTLGSGAPGGIFSPLLFIGATIGALIWILQSHLFGNTIIYSSIYVIAGMAGMIAGATGCFITGCVLCIEITKNFQSVIPVVITSIVALMVRKMICSDSIYTLKLTRRNIDLLSKHLK